VPKKTWTDNEIEILKENFDKMTQKELQNKYFHNKSLNSIKWQIERQRLGKTDYYSEYEEDTIKYLRQHNVPCRTIGKLLNRSEGAIMVKCQQMKIYGVTPSDYEDTLLVNEQNLLKNLDTKLVGTINEEFVKIKLSLLGYDIAIPYMNNHKIDMFVFRKRKMVKIQIKSATYDSTEKRFRASLKTKDKNGKHIKYSNDDVDFFIIKCNGLDVFYILPYNDVKNESYANLYPHRLKLRIKGFDFEKYKNNFILLDDFLEGD